MGFDIRKRDSQATEVAPIAAARFDFDAYGAYEKDLLAKTGAFAEAGSGVAVYRRFRSAEVFAEGCRDMKRSLELQLGCLKTSMDYRSDIPNFLEPWYGIGACAAAYGADYVWNDGQAPAVLPQFDDTAQALRYTPKPVAGTAVGKHTLAMIGYFLEQTKGKLPLSFADAQSPLNASTMIVNNTNLLMDILINPEQVKQFLNILAGLSIDFVNEQKKLIGSCLTNPGHGFASARNFCGYGQSDDNIVMLSNEQYANCALPSFGKVGRMFGGPALHSCGNWSDKLPLLTSIDGLKTVDAAFSPETDPDPNPALPFADALANTGIVLNARIVGNAETIGQIVQQLWRPGMKLIVTTYCHTPEEQKIVYETIHEVCQE